jgi:hypothetical protein
MPIHYPKTTARKFLPVAGTSQMMPVKTSSKGGRIPVAFSVPRLGKKLAVVTPIVTSEAEPVKKATKKRTPRKRVTKAAASE